MCYVRIFNSRQRSYNSITPQRHGWCFSPTITTQLQLSILEVLSELIGYSEFQPNSGIKFCSILFNGCLNYLLRLLCRISRFGCGSLRIASAYGFIFIALILNMLQQFNVLSEKLLIHDYEVLMQLNLNAMVGVSHRPLIRS